MKQISEGCESCETLLEEVNVWVDWGFVGETQYGNIRGNVRLRSFFSFPSKLRLVHFLSSVMKVMPSKFLCEYVHLQKVLDQLMESKTYAYLCSPLPLSGFTPTLSPRPSHLIMLQTCTPLR